MLEPVDYEGTVVRIGKRDYVVPALSVRQVKKHRATLATAAAMTANPTDEQVDAITTVVVDALRRNYPNLDVEAFQDELDMVSLPLAMRAIIGQTGLEARGSGEAPGDR